MSNNVSNVADDALNVFDAAVGTPAPTTARTTTATSLNGWKANELTVGSMILAYGLIVIAISSWLMIRGKDSEAVLRMVAVISAVVIAAFLLVVGYDNDQMNPVIGLLGTIVGYLLGKEQGVRTGAREEIARQSEIAAAKTELP